MYPPLFFQIEAHAHLQGIAPPTFDKAGTGRESWREHLERVQEST